MSISETLPTPHTGEGNKLIITTRRQVSIPRKEIIEMLEGMNKATRTEALQELGLAGNYFDTHLQQMD